MSKISVYKSRCKGCGICVEFCPLGVLELSEELNDRGYEIPRVVNKEKCTACGLCELMCPDFAIAIDTG